MDPYFSLTCTKVQIHTRSKSPQHPHTLGGALCRHNIVVSGISSYLPREGDDCHLTLGGGGVPVVQVNVGWIRTIVNGAVIPWLKYALHKAI